MCETEHNGTPLELTAPARSDCPKLTVGQHRVLVVDDDPLVLASLGDLLGRDGFDVECAVSGEAALVSIEQTCPCLVILDLMLPGVDGIEVLRQIRGNASLSEISVIAVTGSDSDSLLKQCIQYGIADFVHKPYDREELRFRIRSQMSLHESRQLNRQLQLQLEAISTAAQDAIVVLDDTAAVTFWNHAATRMFGYRESEALGYDVHELIAPARYHKTLRQVFDQFRATGRGNAIGRTVEVVGRHKNGAEFPVELSLSATQISARWCAVGIVRDITERKRHEATLKESELLQRTLLENLTAGVVIVDVETGVIERINRAAASLLRCEIQEMRGRPCDSAICFMANGARPVPDPKPSGDHAEGELLRGDGSRLPVLRSVTLIELEGSKKLLQTFVDLTEQKLRDGLYRAIFENSFDAIMTIHAGTRSYSSANPACLKLFGANSEYDFLLRTPADYSPEWQPDGRCSSSEYERLLYVALAEGHVSFDWTHRKLDGASFESEVLLVRLQHGAVTQVQAIVRDVSESRRVARQLEAERLICERMELEIRASQKLEAIGQLAAGIAHEINTPTQFASDSVHFLQEALTSQQQLVERCRELQQRCLGGEEPRHLVEEFQQAERELDLDYFREQGPAAARNAVEGLSRIATIVRAMKEFSHPDASEKAPADLNTALQNTLMIARAEYKYVAEVETQYGELPSVTCHLGALNQVFLNLIVNAAHAIADKVGSRGAIGRIGVRTLSEGDSVRVEISDTGIGIPLALRSRVFEPFFTTKEVGRGTGQGLAIAHSIVCGRHGGTISFETIEGEGTTFTVRIPVEAQPG